MRNFSTEVKSSSFVTFNVNDEYFKTTEEVVHDVIRAVVCALEISYEQFCSAASHISSQGTLAGPDDYHVGDSVSLSEGRVIADLWLFYCESLQLEDAPYSGRVGHSASFFYCNMNTGRSVVWTRFCG